MITVWRKAFDDPGMHFYMVQISASSFHGGMLGVWEAQRRAAAALPNCGIAVTNDIYQQKFQSVDPETSWPLQGHEKDQIEVHSPEVAAPKDVRFSWHMFARNNLVNSEDLPAFVFRTDDDKDPRAR